MTQLAENTGASQILIDTFCSSVAAKISRHHGLFVAEGFDGVEAGGLGGGPDAEDQADGDGNGKADDHGPQRHHRLHRGDHGDERNETAAEENADQPAGTREGHGLEEELPGDVAAARADGFADADLLRALGDGDEHDVHHAHAADEQANGAEHDDGEDDALNDVVELLHGLDVGLNEEIVGLGVGHIAAAAQHFADLVHGGIELAGIGLHAHGDFVASGIELEEGIKRNHDAAVFVVGAEAAILLLQNADDQEFRAVHDDFLIHGVFDAREKRGGGVLTEHDDIVAVVVFRVGEEAADLHARVRVDLEIGGKSSAKLAALDLVVLIARVVRQLPLEHRDSDLLHRRAHLANGEAILESERLALALVFRAAADARALLDAGDPGGVGAFGHELVLDARAETLDQPHDKNNEGHADHHAEHGQEAAQLVAADGVDREMQIFAEILLHHVSSPPAALRWDPGAWR